ncbi:C-C motif chemokine 20a.3 [Anoplopoma fimbria]|uniref:C-C motif chemokine 20 n=1 Tax=Anoplopoma fimbria TaxID=229290 RepID=C3KH33_ANOFI|nr:C-C motif chemokine 20a.3 [Anoplopoma fimbria]ACQ57955.1 C-C motif chemokine 20 precursor [Anoplopoma fimbria]
MVSIKASVVVLTLLSACLLATNVSAVYHGCCRHYTTNKIPFHKIKGYSVQTVTEMCHINSIIFHTRKGKACMNPAHNWVMDYVNRLRTKAQMVHNKTSQAHG